MVKDYISSVNFFITDFMLKSMLKTYPNFEVKEIMCILTPKRHILNNLIRKLLISLLGSVVCKK